MMLGQLDTICKEKEKKQQQKNEIYLLNSAITNINT